MEHRLQKFSFDKNIGIVGGLLAFAAFGPGRFAIGKLGTLGSLGSASPAQ
jgi:uncharacterized membrane protein YphA (DoxX/SURF4 family)